MNQKELKELIEFLKEQDIAEFELERGDVKVRIKRAIPSAAAPETRFVAIPTAAPAVQEIPSAPHPVGAAAPAGVPKEPPSPPRAAEDGLHVVRSPIVGTFYESPSPGAPPFVKAGDTVDLGQVLCIVEAMKLMNEIESDIAGEIVKRLVNNGQPVEYGQELFAIRPNK
jgi:acetyl-CoA carboxylase biotin carboxyl carrier protein